MGRKNYFMLCPIKPTNVLHTKKKNIVVFEFNAMFGSFEREESREKESSGEESRGEWLFSTLFGCF